MSTTWPSIPPAVLQVPDTQKPCISSKEFIEKLRSFDRKIVDIINRLEGKQPGERLSLTFEIDFHRNAVSSELTTDGNDNKFVLRCYCNG